MIGWRGKERKGGEGGGGGELQLISSYRNTVPGNTLLKLCWGNKELDLDAQTMGRLAM